MITRKPFFFLRHGETDHNAKKILAGGDCDVPLNDTGLKQAEKIRPFIESLPIQVIYHSPMLRAKQTMERASQSLQPNRIEIGEESFLGKGLGQRMIQAQETPKLSMSMKKWDLRRWKSFAPNMILPLIG